MSEKYLGSATLMDMAKFVYGILLFFRGLYKKPRTFVFENKRYVYFEHPYNGTWMNERSVEISLVWELLKEFPSNKVLEVGNVLTHYYNVSHLVVDKYERKTGVIPVDILDIKFDQRFDCIVSISTLEHVGWDEIPHVPGKHIQAIEKLMSLLSDDGILIATIPLGYNPSFDSDIFEKRLQCNRVVYFKRTNMDTWSVAEQEQVVGSQYGKRYRTTDGLAICMWKK